MPLTDQEPTNGKIAELFQKSIDARSATVGIIGLGYVGIPLALSFIEHGFRVVGFDIDPVKIETLNSGNSYIHHIPAAAVRDAVEAGRFRATADYADVAKCDAVLLCVPTPLNQFREPDLGYVTGTAEAIVPYLRPGQLIVLESTTYPGTTTDVLRPILERSGYRSEAELFIAYSPEREDPGNPDFRTTVIPKVVGADGEAALQMACALYRPIVPEVIPVSSARTAEAVKLTENIFRCVNIALVNELKIVFEGMDIDIWEVIEAAKTKPFGYMPFYPGPGLGGHCIPIDPFYLSWKAREFDIATRFIELAGEINTAMPQRVVQRLAEALDRRFGKGLRSARILIVGLAYKKNVDDLRESPSLRIMSLLLARSAVVSYFDPYIPEILQTRQYPDLAGQRSIELTADAIESYDAVLICTDHDGVDYDRLARHAALTVDTRNAMRSVRGDRSRIVKA